MSLHVDHDPKELERRARNINPGGWAVESERPITTLLGSCVAVCLYDPKMRIGGMNHFLLPSRAKNSSDDTDVILAGDYSMEVLLNTMLNKGAAKPRLVAKAFGGGTIVTSILMAIGQRNADFAKEWLEREGIPLMAQDFGGAWSRKVIFTPNGGDAFCRRMPISQPDVKDVVRAEQAYEQSLVRPAATTTQKRVELF
jgi:chemotaxis protein CheD